MSIFAMCGGVTATAACIVLLVGLADGLAPSLEVCAGKTCAKNALSQRTLETARALAGPTVGIRAGACRGKCGAGRVSVAGPSDRVYDVAGASPATLAAVLEIELDAEITDAAVDACARLDGLEALARRDRGGALAQFRAALDDDAFAAAPRAHAAAVVRAYDLSDAAAHAAMEPALAEARRRCPDLGAVAWRLAGLYADRRDCAAAADVLARVAAADAAAAANVADALEACVVS